MIESRSVIRQNKREEKAHDLPATLSMFHQVYPMTLYFQEYNKWYSETRRVREKRFCRNKLNDRELLKNEY